MKTNRTLKLITLTAAIFGFAATSFGQSSATASGVTASATIIAPIAITNNNSSLNFGVIVPGTTAGSVTLPADGGTRTTTGGTSVLTTQTGNPTLATFTVTGQENYTYALTLPTTSVPLSGAGVSMSVSNFDSNIGDGPTVAGITLTAGTSTFNVGATIAVGASQAVGVYNGTFDVIVAYE